MKNMKSILFTFAALLVSISISAQQQQPQKPVSVPQTLIKLNSPADTLQYTLGAFIGQWMIKNSFSVTNPVLFKRGMDDVLQNKKLAVTDSTIVPIVAAYQLATQNARSRLMEEQLFAALKGKPGVGALPDGVHYIVVKAGTGIRPTQADSIVINAIGIFPDGTVFEDTFQKKKAITTLTGSLIPGLNETIQLMPEGSVWRIFVPSALAYGPAGLPNLIPSNTALVFDITLMEVKGLKKN
ncbi:MAG: FKBP-type peptidyl-prolyl cis-trans isomerase [Bacteroidia bacterium]|nr:FKBP-type peptidyl-prolyl cis-trans isomerase [Bacteroidia bacterium]